MSKTTTFLADYLGWSLRVIETPSNATWSYEWEVSKGEKVCRDPTSHRSKDAAELHGKLAIESLQTQRLTMTQETKIEPRSRALALELMGVLADVDHAGSGAFDWVCYHTVKRVMEELLAGNVDTFTNPELEHMAEEAECVHKCLDDVGVPRVNEAGDGLLYSLWGRVSLYGKRRGMPEAVGRLVERLRMGADFEDGHYIGKDDMITEAADALEEAYGVTSKDSQCY